MIHLVSLLDVSFAPNPAGIPGTGSLTDFTNGLGAVGLVLVLAGVVIGVPAALVGRVMGNALVSVSALGIATLAAVSAFLIGGAAIIVNFFFHAGGSLH